jgi:Fur family transcriptional regulator, iron response regulator
MTTEALATLPQPTLNRDDVIRLLNEHGLKPTQQRLVVAEVLLAQPTHLSADQILSTLRGSGEQISKATVYNTLSALVECGLVRQIHLDPDRSVYDSTRASHHHFHDVESGALWDIKPEDIAFSRFPPLPEGMETASVEVVVRVRRKLS